jgi:hypothetical protein
MESQQHQSESQLPSWSQGCGDVKGAMAHVAVRGAPAHLEVKRLSVGGIGARINSTDESICSGGDVLQNMLPCRVRVEHDFCTPPSALKRRNKRHGVCPVPIGSLVCAALHFKDDHCEGGMTEQQVRPPPTKAATLHLPTNRRRQPTKLPQLLRGTGQSVVSRISKQRTREASQESLGGLVASSPTVAHDRHRIRAKNIPTTQSSGAEQLTVLP